MQRSNETNGSIRDEHISNPSVQLDTVRYRRGGGGARMSCLVPPPGHTSFFRLSVPPERPPGITYFVVRATSPEYDANGHVWEVHAPLHADRLGAHANPLASELLACLGFPSLSRFGAIHGTIVLCGCDGTVLDDGAIENATTILERCRTEHVTMDRKGEAEIRRRRRRPPVNDDTTVKQRRRK